MKKFYALLSHVSPQLLTQKVKDQPDYVDDILFGLYEDDEANAPINEALLIFKNGKNDLCFYDNSLSLIQEIPNVINWLSKQKDKKYTILQFCKMLEKNGFTERESYL